ncbi:RNA-binding cell elongation regulator Jag/EloR [Bacillus kwashiorkori]|uniref:RNA-binding cell elongation regulator Jag/EloR n=1 Tax=Bacillus kwashiorkori TaxID=1522318 RepID=UPI0007836586|nr:RNA-binding cell elongation regulator Jag/EloR [Bacillus kwashiorkori]
MKQVTATGPSIEEAVQNALLELNTTEDRVEVKIIDEGKKGIFGVFGSRPAVVKVTVVINPIAEAEKFLKAVCSEMDIDVQINIEQEDRNVRFELTADKAALLIGKRGQTLNALQSLTQLLLNRYSEQFMIVQLDAENYRKKREESLTILANRLASKVVREKKEVKLEPMPSYERKIIHAALSGNKEVTTYSVGSDPNRHLVIAPNSSVNK